MAGEVTPSNPPRDRGETELAGKRIPAPVAILGRGFTINGPLAGEGNNATTSEGTEAGSTQPAWSSEAFLAELEEMQGRGFLLPPADVLLDASLTDPGDLEWLEDHVGRERALGRK